MRNYKTNGRWAGLAVLVQIASLFAITGIEPDSPKTILPVVLVSLSSLITLEGWVKLKGWR